MGKSNRIKTKRAADAMSLGLKSNKREKKSMPLWAVNLITISCAVLVLVAVAFTMITSNGVFGRIQTAASSENFRVTKNMMTYYLKTTYDEYTSSDSSYSSYLTAAGFSKSISPKDQFLDANDPTQGTWHDFFVSQTKLEINRMLVYCEEAHARGIELTEEDQLTIDNQISMIEIYAQIYQYDTNSYVASMYGPGMKIKDVRQAMELATLASKCATVISEEIKAGISDEDISGEYDKNKKDYDLIDYIYYEYTVKYSEAAAEAFPGIETSALTAEQKAVVLEKYKQMIADARAKAEALAKLGSLDEFKSVILDDIADDIYSSSYSTTEEDVTVEAEKIPAEEVRKAIKEKLIPHVKALVIEGKAYEKITVEADGKYTVFGVEVTKEYADFFEEFAALYASNIEYTLGRYLSEGATYNEEDDAIKWMFADGTADGATKAFETGDAKKNDDGSSESIDGKDHNDLSSFKVAVYRVNKAQYKDDNITKNIGVLTFSSAEEAEAVIASLKAGMTLDEFKALAGENGTYSNFEDYAEGDGGSDMKKFDEWAFADTTTVGSVTSTVIEFSTESNIYGVAIYHAEGHEQWYVTVRDSLYSDAVDKIGEELAEKYTVEYNDKALAKLDICI